MPTRWLLVATTCLLMLGCSPPTYGILARGDANRLIFAARGSGSWLFRSDDDIEAESLEVRDGSHLVWALERDPDRPNCRAEGRTPPFPLTYGEIPACYVTTVPAEALRQGVLYRITGSGFRHGQGYFRLQGAVRNLEWDKVEAEVGQWSQLSRPVDPRDELPAQDSSNTAAAPAAAERNAVSANKP